MSQGIALLDEALNLARQEKNALEAGAYDQAIELAEKRGKITGMAWDFANMSDNGQYRGKLLELSGLQAQLTEIATRAKEVVRQKLGRSKVEKRRMRGYHMAVEQALQ